MENKGASLYFVIVILAVLTTSLLSLLNFSLSQIKVIWSVGDSVNAFYAADSGIEQGLYRLRQEGNFDNFSGVLGEASYQVSITSGDGTTVDSIGLYHNTKRGIEINYE